MNSIFADERDFVSPSTEPLMERRGRGASDQRGERPVKIGLNPAPSAISAPTRPRIVIVPRSGLMSPFSIFNSVMLIRAFRGVSPYGLPAVVSRAAATPPGYQPHYAQSARGIDAVSSRSPAPWLHQGISSKSLFRTVPESSIPPGEAQTKHP
jgi:hypothetical protein